MSAKASPRPWHTANFINGIEDANNGKVAANIRAADAALIVDAVNERDRLRDLVRRLSRHLENYITSESENDLLREARAAIGEDKE